MYLFRIVVKKITFIKPQSWKQGNTQIIDLHFDWFQDIYIYFLYFL